MNLRDLRWRSGLLIDDVVGRLQQIEPTAPTSRNGLILIERRGTTNLRIIRALATIYDAPFDEVAAAAAVPATESCRGRGRKFRTEMVQNA